MCSLCRLPVAKNHNFLHFWGLLYQPPFIDEGQIWCAIADPRYSFTCEILSRSVNSVVLWRQKKLFLPFFGLWHLVMSPIGINLRYSSTGAQLRTFPYPKASKSFLYSNAFMAKLDAQTLTFKSLTDRQTDRQTDKKLNVFGHPANRAPPNLAW